MLPGLPQLAAAAVGGLAVAVGLVLLLNGAILGAVVAAAGVLLIWWSILRPH